MGKEFVASVRIAPVTGRAHLHAMGKHAMRLDGASQRRRRPEAKLGDALAFSSLVHAGSTGREFGPMRDVVAAYDFHLQHHGIRQTKQGGMGFHALISVSAAWVAEAGGVHDINNPRNRSLLLEAVKWVESWCGRNSVYAGRVDLDEEGGGNVDVFVMPVRIDKRIRAPAISASKALTELRLKHGQRMSYVAAQTDWAEWCQSRLDSRIQRGRPKAETLIDHLEVDEYKAAHTEARRRADLVYAQAALELEQLRLIVHGLRQLGLEAEDRNRIAQLEAGATHIAASLPGRRRGS